METYKSKFSFLAENSGQICIDYKEALTYIATYCTAVNSVDNVMEIQDKWYVAIHADLERCKTNAIYWIEELLPIMHVVTNDIDSEHKLVSKQLEHIANSLKCHLSQSHDVKRNELSDELVPLLNELKKIFTNRKNLHETICESLEKLTDKFKEDVNSYSINLNIAVEELNISEEELKQIQEEIDKLQHEINVALAFLCVGLVIFFLGFVCFAQPAATICIAGGSLVASTSLVTAIILNSKLGERMTSKGEVTGKIAAIKTIENTLKNLVSDKVSGKLIESMKIVTKSWTDTDQYLEKIINELNSSESCTITFDYLSDFYSNISSLSTDLNDYYDNQTKIDVPLPEVNIQKIML